MKTFRDFLESIDETVSEMTHRFVFDKAVNLDKAEKLAKSFKLKTDSETQSNYYYLSVDDGGNTNNLVKWLKATDGLHEQVTEGSESWEDGFKRRVVKTTKPEHKNDGYNWRIKGKDKDHLSIKLYKNKPDFAEFKKQMKRVAGHQFGG